MKNLKEYTTQLVVANPPYRGTPEESGTAQR